MSAIQLMNVDLGWRLNIIALPDGGQIWEVLISKKNNEKMC
jgi:hypothetical protein